jgi:large subunit ribosomal protein L29
MTKSKELRDMADEQIRLVWKDAAETLFRLRIQSQTEKLAAPTEMKKFRRTIARCQTILAQRGVLTPAVPEGAADGVDASPQHEKHAKKHSATGRAKVRSVTKGRVDTRRDFKKRTQSGN